jgi:hypothetical protein
LLFQFHQDERSTSRRVRSIVLSSWTRRLNRIRSCKRQQGCLALIPVLKLRRQDPNVCQVLDDLILQNCNQVALLICLSVKSYNSSTWICCFCLCFCFCFCLFEMHQRAELWKFRCKFRRKQTFCTTNEVL